MIRRSADRHTYLDGMAFVVLSDVFINVTFLLIGVLVMVALTSSSALKQVQIRSDQDAFFHTLMLGLPSHWRSQTRQIENGNFQRLMFYDTSDGTGSQFFAPGRWNIAPQGHALLAALAPLIRAQIRSGKVVRIEVEGHTDQQPMGPELKALVGDSYGLSILRAIAVTNELRRLEVPPSCIDAVGRGEYDPQDNASTPAAWAKNRRVEIILVYGAADGQST